ncbi:WD repeat-containing protein 20 [Chrysoperla carnea]|uniref:WD repeat-containing protein 20 n=1 Tax=Chrysoperla carnea TaxID=189513 RepID=UPI001D074DA4|nr:WD repeat-containing protein 20 [Chrysoperla carnea]
MAVQMDTGGKDDVKTQFSTREGIYRLMTLSEYSRPSRGGYPNNQGSSGAQVRVSFVTMPDPSGNGDKICFNYGKELYVYVYKGIKKAVDQNKPIDKKMYKGTNPTCHDFNSVTMTTDSVSLLIGFSTGQIQLIDPMKKELSKLFNEDRLIDKTKVTCIHWVPGSTNLFLVSHASGQLYVYNEELMCGTTPPNYQPFKQGDGYAIHTCKTKSTRNPLYRWVIGNEGCCINEFAFSPCGTNLAVVSQDGFLRVFHYDTMELIGMARSYFGGFLCVCWSPDGRYIVVGGEDDLVTVWSFHERRVVARGQGHRSWVSVVAFDPFTTSFSEPDCHDFSGSDDESQQTIISRNTYERNFNKPLSNRNSTGSDCNNRVSTSAVGTCYRLGSVSQDTQICLWDITEDVLRQPLCLNKNRTSVLGSGNFTGSGTFVSGNGHKIGDGTSTSSDPVTTSKPSTIKTTINKVGLKSDSKISNISVNHADSNSKKVLNSKSNNVNISLSNSVSPTVTNCKDNGQTNTTTGTNEVQIGNNIHGSPSVSVSNTVTTVNSFTQRITTGLGFGDKKSDSSHKRNFSLGSKGASNSSDLKTNTVTLRTKNLTDVNKRDNDKVNTSNSMDKSSICDPLRLIGTPACPRFDECPVLEPLICKKIAQERLTTLVFREDCFVTACQEGIVYTWARPGSAGMPGGGGLNNTSTTITAAIGTSAGGSGGAGGVSGGNNSGTVV